MMLHVEHIKFTGTIASYNKIVKKAFPYEKFTIIFNDKDLNNCNCFCYGFHILEYGMYFKPGDFVQVGEQI